MSEKYPFEKQNVMVVGATGQIGQVLTKALLQLGHNVKALNRHKEIEGKYEKLAQAGAEIIHVPDMNDLDAMVEILDGIDVFISSTPATPEIVLESQSIWLQACVKAGVKRFVPNEFGAHTRGLDFGDGKLFDWKKQLHQKIFDSGIGWTLFYNGGIFDYFLPNLRFFEKITTFGNLDINVYTHEIQDIGRVAAMALTDPRTINRCVQMDFNVLTQNQAVSQIKENFPDYKFEFVHYTEEQIIHLKETASDTISAKKGAETDAERWGINFVIYVKGKLASFTEDTVRGSELYPDYKVLASPAQALKDPNFVFETSSK